MLCSLLLALLSFPCLRLSGFKEIYGSRRLRAATPLLMGVSYPYSIKNVVTKMTESMQKALQARTIRIEVELPANAEYGVEAPSKGMVSAVERVKRSNREAARLFTDMLSSFSTNMVILFPSEDEAREARKVWGVTLRAQVLSIDAPDAAGFGKLRSRRFSALEQEQALLASEGVYVPEGTEVLIIAGPRSKDLKKIRRLHEKLGEDCVIVLLNGRLSAQDILQQSATVLEECSQLKSIFTPVFHYAPPALSNQGGDKDRELLLYHEYAGKWSLAEKDKDSKGILGLKLGSSVFKTLWEGDSFPEASLIQSTLSTVNK